MGIYIGEDGKIHFTDKAGADSVLNFSNVTSTFSIKIPYTNRLVIYGTGGDVYDGSKSGYFTINISDGVITSATKSGGDVSGTCSGGWTDSKSSGYTRISFDSSKVTIS